MMTLGLLYKATFQRKFCTRKFSSATRGLVIKSPTVEKNYSTV